MRLRREQKRLKWDQHLKPLFVNVALGITFCANGMKDPHPLATPKIQGADRAIPCRFCFQVSFLTIVSTFLTNKRNMFICTRRADCLHLRLAGLLASLRDLMKEQHLGRRERLWYHHKPLFKKLQTMLCWCVLLLWEKTLEDETYIVNKQRPKKLFLFDLSLTLFCASKFFWKH